MSLTIKCQSGDLITIYLLQTCIYQFCLMKLFSTCTHVGVNSLNKTFFIHPILPLHWCHYDIKFCRSLQITTIRLGKLSVLDKFAAKL